LYCYVCMFFLLFLSYLYYYNFKLVVELTVLDLGQSNFKGGIYVLFF
jgi:hypothetical protein